MAYYRMPAHQLLFSETEVACGKYCGKTIELQMKVMFSTRKVFVKISYLSGLVLFNPQSGVHTAYPDGKFSFVQLGLCRKTFFVLPNVY